MTRTLRWSARALLAASVVIASLATSPELAAEQAPVQPPADAAKPKPKTAVAGPVTRPPAPKPPPRVLEGVVKAPDGKPVENARVTYRAEDGMFGRPPATVKTDAAGRFRVELKAITRLNVRIEAEGFASRVLESVKPGPPIMVTLDHGRILEGTIRDAAGQPVPGARVVARASTVEGMFWDPTVGQTTARTDAKGRYRLVGLEPALFTVSAGLAGVGQASRANVRPVGRLDLVLGPASGLAGEVVDAAGQPVAGAVVHAEKPPFGEGDTDTADGQGRFQMPGLSPGNYMVAAKHADFAPGVGPEVAVASDSEARVQIVLDAGTTIVGRIVDASEHPLTGTIVIEQWADRLANAALAAALRGDAGPDGRFRLERVAGGNYSFGVRAPSMGSKTVEVNVSGRPGVVDLGDVVLEPGLGLRGRVHTKAGMPVADALVAASLQRPMFGGFPTTEARADADGSFILAGLAAGTYELTAAAPGFTKGRTKAVAGGENVDLTVDAAGSLSGLVVEEGDRPVEGFHLHAEPQTQSQRAWENDRQKAVGNPDGRFLLEDLAEGAYVLQVLVPDRAPATVSNARVIPGQTTDVGTIRVPRGGIVRGVVVDATAGPVAGAKVRVSTGTNEMLNWWGLMTALTDAGGAFEVKGVPTGAIKVTASHPSFAASEATAEVDPAKAPAEVRIVLMQGGRIDGALHQRDGRPVPGQLIWLMGAQMAAEFAWPITGADGTFVVEHVPAGRLKVMVMASLGPGQYTNGMSRDVEVREGEAVSVDFVSREVLVSGRVTRSGAPAGAVELNVQAEQMQMSLMMGGPASLSQSAPTGPQRNRAVTRDDGAFELLLGEPGRYNVSARLQGQRTQFPNRLVEVPDVEAYSIDLDFSGASLAGLVVARESREPVAEAYVSAQAHGLKDGKVEQITGSTGPDGRFELLVTPGDYAMQARADGFAQLAPLEVRVGDDGVGDLRLELERGREISGRVVDAGGRGIAGVEIFGRAGVGPKAGAFGNATTRGDGTFLMQGLRDLSYNLCAATEMAGLTCRTAVKAGTKDLSLALQPGGRVRLLVLGLDGAPRAGAYASMIKLGGADVSVPGYGSGASDASGRLELTVAAGTVEVQAGDEKGLGRTTVTVASGQVVDAEIRLTEPADQP